MLLFYDYALVSRIPPALARRYVAADGMLQIMSVNLRDEGAYTCVARTSLDKDNATALLTVLGKSGARCTKKLTCDKNKLALEKCAAK